MAGLPLRAALSALQCQGTVLSSACDHICRCKSVGASMEKRTHGCLEARHEGGFWGRDVPG